MQIVEGRDENSKRTHDRIKKRKLIMELLQVWAGRDLKSLIENLCLHARREVRGEAGERYSDKDSFGFLLRGVASNQI